MFVDRCGLAQDICRREEPAFFDLGGGRHSRCHFWEQAHELPRAAPASGLRSVIDADSEPVIRTEGMYKTFRQEGHDVRAVDDVSLVLRRGETLGLVGESGSGKTTLARALLGLTAADQGSVIELDGRLLPTRIDKRDAEHVRALQIVFQNRLGPEPAVLGAPDPEPRLVEAAPRPQRRARGPPARASPSRCASTCASSTPARHSSRAA